MIVIIDYKMGNVGSVQNMLKRLGCPAKISDQADEIRRAERLILPGVGAFDNGMRNIASLGLREVLDEKVLKDKTPVLGICLGMQLLCRGSEEGNLPGLGWIAADTVRFRQELSGKPIRIPHMGWNIVEPVGQHELFYGFEEKPRFYFVHSYHVACDRPELTIGRCEYGYQFAAAVNQENVSGVQFHPEKSHRFGLRLLANFAGLFGHESRSTASAMG